MWGYTGATAASRCSVMAHGMGIPSASIYCHELMRRVRRQAHHPRRQLRHRAPRRAAARHRHRHGRLHGFGREPHALPRLRLCGDRELPRSCAARSRIAEQKSLRSTSAISSRPTCSTRPSPRCSTLMANYDILGVEMEAAGIYTIAAEFGVEALAICTVSDHIRDRRGAQRRRASDDVRRDDRARARHDRELGLTRSRRQAMTAAMSSATLRLRLPTSTACPRSTRSASRSASRASARAASRRNPRSRRSKLALTMIDLTTLEGQDTPGKVTQLCRKAMHLHDALPGLPHVAAVCVYPTMVARRARRRLHGSGDQGRLGRDGLPERHDAARRSSSRKRGSRSRTAPTRSTW